MSFSIHWVPGKAAFFSSLPESSQDDLTPNMQAPFYGREATIVVQVVTGLLLTLFSLIQLIILKLATSLNDLLTNKIFLFNSGVFIFTLSFIIGSLVKQ